MEPAFTANTLQNLKYFGWYVEVVVFSTAFKADTKYITRVTVSGEVEIATGDINQFNVLPSRDLIEYEKA